MKNIFKRFSESKTFFSIISVAIFLIAISFVFGFIVKPILDDKPYQDCVNSAEKILSFKIETFEKAFIEKHINSLKKFSEQAEARVDFEKEKERCFKTYKK